MISHEDFSRIIMSICDHLSERTAVLFLGAGVNPGIYNTNGSSFPLGAQLSKNICHDLLDSPDLELPLDEASEIAKYKFGPEALNNYLFENFTSFKPSPGHLSIVQLPWDAIYTTNYDLLVEEASKLAGSKDTGFIYPIVDAMTNIDRLSENDIPYYKLHGSVDVANTPEGRLILSKEDYRFYEAHRKPLFRRLKNDLTSRTFVFVGYSLRDPNFRAILSDCREELDVRALPLSFAIRKNVSDVELAFWREKHNIQLIEAEAGAFLTALFDAWTSQNRKITSFLQRSSRHFELVDDSTRFPRHGNIFYQVVYSECNSKNNAQIFFRGAEPNWGTIRDKIAPERDSYWLLMEQLFADLCNPNAPPSAYLVTGHAGTGKTTLVRTIALDIAKDFKTPVLIHIPGTPLDINVLAPFFSDEEPKRVTIIIHNAGERLDEIDRFYYEIKRLSLPVSIILEDRKNQWLTAISNTSVKFSPAEIELDSLSENEIDRILKALSEHNSLGKLNGMPFDYQKNHFMDLAGKELLVALRELTSETSFDKIIEDEFNNIPSDLAKNAYVYVSALGQADLAMRYETLIRVLNINYNQLGNEIFRPTDGILLSGEMIGYSRHNIGFRLRTRHPIIASVIFSSAAVNDQSKYKIITDVIHHLDPGYREDRNLLEQLVHRKSIVNTLSDPELRRAVFLLLERALPDQAFVLQHRSILEKDIGDHEQSLLYAQKAARLDGGKSQSIKNTLGLALEFSSRFTNDELRIKALLQEAEKIFDQGIRLNPESPYDYIGKYNVARQRIENEGNNSKKVVEQAQLVNFLEEAYESTFKSSMIAGILANERKNLGETIEAMQMLEGHLKKNPADERLCNLLVQIKTQSGETKEALEWAIIGAKHDPASWRLQRHIARLLQKLDGTYDAIKGHFEAAMRHRQGDLHLTVEYASYLFMCGEYSESSMLFSKSRDYRIPAFRKREILYKWKDNGDNLKIFNGKVHQIRLTTGFVIAIPENFKAFFWRTKNALDSLKEGDTVKFTVGFNAYGASAYILKK